MITHNTARRRICVIYNPTAGERVQVDGDIAAALPLVVSVCERPVALLR